MKINFTKMQSCGNDYIYIKNCLSLDPLTVTKLCDRHFGIGSDGVVLINDIKGNHCTMTVYNSDGTLAQTCGNALRCVAHLVSNDNETVTISSSQLVTVQCNKPYYTTTLHANIIGGVAIKDRQAYRVDVGNKHLIELVDDLNEKNFHHWQSYYDTHNIELVKVIDKHNIELLVRERGSGITLACGSGATATMALLTALKLTDSWCNIRMAGGTVVARNVGDNNYSLTGDAVIVFTGEVEI